MASFNFPPKINHFHPQEKKVLFFGPYPPRRQFFQLCGVFLRSVCSATPIKISDRSDPSFIPKCNVTKPSQFKRNTLYMLFYSKHIGFIQYTHPVARKKALSWKNSTIQRDNARPHTANATQIKLKKLGITVIDNPPYSPDLSPSDYYLLSPMKSSIRG